MFRHYKRDSNHQSVVFKPRTLQLSHDPAIKTIVGITTPKSFPIEDKKPGSTFRRFWGAYKC